MSPKALKGPERTLSGELRTGLLAGSLGFSSQGVCPQGSHQSVLKTRRTASPEQEELRGRLPERRRALDGSWGFSGPHLTHKASPPPPAHLVAATSPGAGWEGTTPECELCQAGTIGNHVRGWPPRVPVQAQNKWKEK